MKFKTFKCYFTAFSKELEPAYYNISVPENKLADEIEANLDIIYHYGQNDFKIKDKNVVRSLCCGDLIEYEGVIYLIDDFGFLKEGTDEFFENSLTIINLYFSKAKILREKFPKIFAKIDEN